MCHDPLGIGAAGLDPHDLVTALPQRHEITDRVDRAGELEARISRAAGRGWIHAHDLQQVGTIEGRGPHGNDDVLRPAHRVRYVLDRQGLRTTVGAKDYSAHRLSLPWPACRLRLGDDPHLTGNRVDVDQCTIGDVGEGAASPDDS